MSHDETNKIVRKLPRATRILFEGLAVFVPCGEIPVEAMEALIDVLRITHPEEVFWSCEQIINELVDARLLIHSSTFGSIRFSVDALRFLGLLRTSELARTLGLEKQVTARWMHSSSLTSTVIRDRFLVQHLCTHEEALRYFLSAQGGHPNACDIDGRPLLSTAAALGCVDVVSAMLAAGAEPSRRDANGLTPLHHATAAACAELLLLHGADPNAASTGGITPLARAAEAGNAPLCRLLLRFGAQPDCGASPTPLVIAAGKGHKDVPAAHFVKNSLSLTKSAQVCSALVSYGANVNAHDEYSVTALYRAACTGLTAVCKLLLEHGADPNARTRDGSTALIVAAAEGHYSVCRALLEHGADVHARRTAGDTALFAAARHGQSPVCELLLSYGARAAGCGPGPLRWGALTAAAQCGHAGTCHTMMERGVDANDRAADGTTAIHHAALFGHPNVCGVLLSKGAAIDALAEDKSQPLHFAALRGHTDVCGVLLTAGADPFARDRCHRTPLTLARQYGRIASATVIEHAQRGQRVWP